MDVPKIICNKSKLLDSVSVDSVAEEDDPEGVNLVDDCQNKCISYLRNRSFKPSEFLAEVLARDDELNNHHITDKACAGKVGGHGTSFFLSMPKIIFKNFKPFKNYKRTMTVQNIDVVPLTMYFTLEKSVYFNLVKPPTTTRRTGPGTIIQITVEFCPHESKDYQATLTVGASSKEEVHVPVQGIGPRAVLDFPDQISFSDGCLKYRNIKTILVRNIGDKAAQFTLSAKKPFSVEPLCGHLEVNECTQVDVVFQPMTTGNHSSEMILHLDSGENIHISLSGVAQDALVKLGRTSVHFDDTYITMTSQRRVNIVNHGPVIAHFRWSRFATLEEEDQNRRTVFCSKNNDELWKEIVGHSSQGQFHGIKEPVIKNRVIEDHRKTLLEDMPYVDGAFSIDPSEGDIWPGCSCDVTTIFRPMAIQSCTAVAFCDITGRESRLPLSLYGKGIGPKVELSHDNLDIGEVFVGSEHSYEVVLANRGFIGASYRFLPSTSKFGRCIQFVPAKGSIEAEQFQAVSIRIQCETLGNFEEQFRVEIIGLKEKLKLTLCGAVIRPSLQVDIQKLKFGHVAFGDGDKPATCNDDLYRHKLDPSLAKKSLMQPFFSSCEELATNSGKVAQSMNASACCGNSDLPGKTDLCSANEKELNRNKNCSLPGVGQAEAAKENCQQEGSYRGSASPSTCGKMFECGPCGKAYAKEIRNKCKCHKKKSGGRMETNPYCCLDPCCKVGIKLPDGKCNLLSDCGDRTCEKKDCQFIGTSCEDKEDCIFKEGKRTPEGCCLQCGEARIKVGDACLKCGGKELLMENTSAVDAIPLGDSEVNEKNAKEDQSMPTRLMKEFNIEPVEGILHPKGEVQVSVGLCSNTLSKYFNMLTVDLIDLEVAVLTIPLSARCVVPPVNLLAPSVHLGRCFLRYPCQLVIQLENDSDLPAKYNVLSQQNPEDESIHYSAPDAVGIVLGESVEDIPLTIYPQRLGVCEVNVPIVLDGQTIPLLFKVTCRGEGPVLLVQPSCLDWAKIPVLCKVEKTISLSNESPILAKFSASLRRDDSVWTLDAEEGEIEPEESCEFSVTAFFNDTLRFSDELIISVDDGVIHKIKLTGCGYGSTIVISPSMRGCVQLGPCFSGTSIEKTFTVTNRGRRIQSVYWQTDGFPLFSKSIHWQKHGKMDDNAPLVPIFQVFPRRSELWPEESTTVSLQAYYDSPTLVEETLNCYSVVDKIPYNHDPILTTRVSCNFIAPLVTFSECNLQYVLDGTRMEGLSKQKKQILMTNQTSLPLTLRLNLTYPFQLCDDMNGQEVYETGFRLQVCETATVSIIFDPFFGDDLESRMAEGTLEIHYREHPHMDKIALKGEVHYPNLNFEWKSIDFGCIINDTEATRYVTMTNTSMLNVRYRWTFVANEKLPVEVSDSSLNAKTRLGNTTGLFDVVTPSWWCLTPNDPHEIESSMGSIEKNEYSEAIMHQMINPALVAVLIQSDPRLAPPGLEETFDIFPLFGTLQPGCSEKVTFTFYGHAFLGNETVAVCEVDGGPKYEIGLKGQASIVQYRFNKPYINFGHIIYNQVAESEIVLMNIGLVGFNFKVVGMDPKMDPFQYPGKALVTPHSGFVAPLTEIVLKVKFLPQVSSHFFSSYTVQVAHFEPVVIEYFGESLFPSIVLHCPRFPFLEDEYDRLLCEAKENVFHIRHIQAQVLEALELDAGHDEAVKSPMEEFFRCQNLTCDAIKNRGSVETFIRTFISPGDMIALDLEVQHEVNQLVVKNFFESQLLITSDENTNSSNSGTMLQRKSRIGQKLPSFSQLVLPGYIIDFGPVLSGGIKTYTTNITNASVLPVSFSIDQSPAEGSGFFISVDQVKELPGQDSVELAATFDSNAVAIKVTIKVNTQLLIHIQNGPVVPLDLMATVVVPSMSLSSSFIDFGEVKCGECCLVSIRLHNTEPIVCNWALKRPKRQTDAMPMFWPMPESGSLQPGEKQNIQIKFEPTEEKVYKSRVEFILAQSTNVASILCMGHGLLPRIEFSKSLVEFNPIVPFGFWECDVSIKNPCAFPVEVYSLEFDTLYLEEEKILRVMKGYDSCRNIYLPPRPAGERLPQELLDSFEEHLQKMERLHQQQQLAQSQDEEEEQEEEKSPSDSLLRGLDMAIKQTEVMPVAAAVARHIGINFHPEGKTAKNRYKIGIIIHGPPISGKTSLATELAKFFNAQVIVVDNIIMDAIQHSNTLSSLLARNLCIEATCSQGEQAQRQHEDAEHGLHESKQKLLRKTTMSNSSAKVSIIGSDFRPRKSRSVKHEDSKTSKLDVHGGSKVPLTSLTPFSDATSLDPALGPLPLVAPEPKHFEIMPEPDMIPKPDETQQATTTVLPEEVVVDLLSEKLMRSDAEMGVVVDGLDSLFTQNYVHTLHAVLKALGNRNYIHLIFTKLNYADLQNEKLKQKKEEEYQNVLREEKERLWQLEMTEDEYDLLPENQKQEFDQKLLQANKIRIQKEKEKRREREEKAEAARLEAVKKRLAEEKAAKKRKGKSMSPRRSLTLNKLSGDGSPEPIKKKDKVLTKSMSMGPSDEKNAKNVKAKGEKKAVVEIVQENVPEEQKPPDELEINLQRRFRTFEHFFRDACDMLDNWDRQSGSVYVADESDLLVPSEDSSQKRSMKRGEKKEKHSVLKEKSRQLSTITQDEEMKIKKPQEDIGIPRIEIDCKKTERKEFAKVAMEAGKFPTVNEMLDKMYVGPSGPPIPPPVTLSVLTFPEKRTALHDKGHYSIVTEEIPPPTKENQRESDIESDTSSAVFGNKPRSPHEKLEGVSKKERKMKSVPKLRRSTRAISSQNQKIDEVTSGPDSVSADSPAKPAKFLYRWIVPPLEELPLKVRFTSTEMGQYDEMLHFEVVGQKQKYRMNCRGTSAFPCISNEPRVVFSDRQKTKKPDEVVIKKFVYSTKTFEFGPVRLGLAAKRAEGNPPENMEMFGILNVSPFDVDCTFSFLKDESMATFTMEPVNLQLKPGEKKELIVWACPKIPKLFEDVLVCCVQNNPEPVTFNLSCAGVRPELTFDKKAFLFEKVLLHRKETKSIVVKNITTLPASWRISNFQTLPSEFSLVVDHMLVPPLSESVIKATFHPLKPILISKKFVRLEVFDEDGLVLLSENILVQAEGYDVSIDISLPKSTSAGIDFGAVRVSEEVKLQFVVRNRGKYEVSFSFSFEPTTDELKEICKLFKISPTSGKLTATDRPINVMITFRAEEEVYLKDQAILFCHVIEPNIGITGEAIARIPIPLSVQAAFSRYEISPSNELNFGALLVNSKKSKTFIIENKHQFFDFSFTISKLSSGDHLSMAPVTPTHATDSKKSRKSNIAAALGPRLLVGPFAVFPISGAVPAKAQAIITVDCIMDSPAVAEDKLVIDIVGRDPADNPLGLSYVLMAESFVPAFDVDNYESIFEEHPICHSLASWNNMQDNESSSECSGVYLLDERRFIFNNVLVGSREKARFKISNNNKIPCDIQVSLKSASRTSKLQHEIFDVEPAKSSIPALNHLFVVVTFSPLALQPYAAILDVSLDSPPAAFSARARSLVVELAGEGHLPQVRIIQPTARNKRCQPVLLFKRSLLGSADLKQIVVANDGPIPCSLSVAVLDSENIYSVRCSSDVPLNTETANGSRGVDRVSIGAKKKKSFDVIFRPTMAERCTSQLLVAVTSNPYGDSIIQLIGEGYQADVTIDNVLFAHQLELDPKSSVEDNAPAIRSNFLQFDDCYVDQSKTLSLQMTNQMPMDSFRFMWPDHLYLKFSPQVGHLHPCASKNILVTLKSIRPVRFIREPVSCYVTKIIYSKPVSEIPDWDDRVKVVKWVDPSTSPVPVRESSHQHSPSNVRQGQSPKSSGHVRQSTAKTGAIYGSGKLPRPTSNLLLKPNSSSTVQDLERSSAEHIAVVSTRPVKKKVIETELEPPNVEGSQSSNAVEMYFSAVVDYCEFELKESKLQFQDTLMFESRFCKLKFRNTGKVQLEYSWQVESCNPYDTVNASTTQLATTVKVPGTVATKEVPLDLPFSIEPKVGMILPGDMVELVVKFSPPDVKSYAACLVSRIPNLNSEDLAPAIDVTGTGIMAYCHFELENSDYLHRIRLSSEHRQSDTIALPLDTRVIEFKTYGIGVRQVRRFDVINPTDLKYTFSWTCTNVIQQKGPSPFGCLTPTGTINGGMQTKMGFCFTSLKTELVESFWNFEIKEIDLQVPFLLVAYAKDPFVGFDMPMINFGSILIGLKSTKTINIVNNEDEPFGFKFLESSLFSAGFQDRLELIPEKGILAAKSNLPITVGFTATFEKESYFRVKCQVERKSDPLLLTVKGEGCCVKSILLFEDPHGHKTEFSHASPFNIDFGTVEVDEKSIRQLHVVNCGKLSFDFTCQMESNSSSGRGGGNFVTVSPISSVVQTGLKQLCLLTFRSSSPRVLNCRLLVKVAFGVTYTINLVGCCKAPDLELSFRVHDFGYCFVHQPGIPANTRTLVIANKDMKLIGIECLTPSTSFFSHSFQAALLRPNEEVEILFIFHPLDDVMYRKDFVFEVNGLSKLKVEMLGHGTNLKLEVADPRLKIVQFGSVFPGQKVTRVIPVINKSAAPITFDLVFNPSSSHLQTLKVISFNPMSDISLPAYTKSKASKDQVTKVEVSFAPTVRVPSFSEEVTFKYGHYCQTLFYISGSCHGLEVSLSTNVLAFGPTFRMNSCIKKLVMRNTGDIGARFEWDAAKFEPDFSISPADGYISAGMDVQFDVTFHPMEVNNYIKCDKLICKIEGGKPLRLGLSGACANLTPPKDVILYATTVRHKEVKSVMIANKTSVPWHLQPSIDGDHWTGPSTLSVPPQSSKAYELIYWPLNMTTDGKKHTGSLLFPLPDGSAIQYALSGTAEPPKLIAKISRDIPCKTSYTEMLMVFNWLTKPQRFSVRIDLLRPEKLDASTKITGLDNILVLGNTSKEYKLSFFAYKEAIISFKVTFTSESSPEYQFYEIAFRSIRPGVLSTISISSIVRHRREHTIVLENPLSNAVTLLATTNIADIQMPGQLVIPPQLEASFTFEYFPLRVGTSQGKLDFTSNELGLFPYELTLKAVQADPERPIYFHTCLGGLQTSMAKFYNCAKARTEYSCKLDHVDFHVDKAVVAAAGSEVAVEVNYEPTAVGESFAMLVLTSNIGGEYRFPLYGTCLFPKPQGPLVIKAGTNITVTFKNVFDDAITFTFVTDNPLFRVNKSDETIKPRKDHKIIVHYDTTPNRTKTTVIGKLTVTCPKSAIRGESNVQWVYYLKGVTPEGKEGKEGREAKDSRSSQLGSPRT